MTDSASAYTQQQLLAQRTRQALLDSAPLFHWVFDTMDQGLVVVDANTGTVLLANPALCRMLDCTPEVLQSLQLLQLLQLQTATALPSLQEFLQDHSSGEAHKTRLPLLCRDGRVLNVEVRSKRLELEGRTVDVALLRDLSDAERAEQAAEQARRDGLTLLYNHRAFQELLGLELSRAQRHGTPVSLLMIDIDHFKQVNDTLGHQAGDAVLRQLAGLLLDSARTIDQICRYGGEEFMLILPMTGTSEALHVAGRLRALVGQHEFACGPGTYRRLTVSIGVASYPLHAQTQTALIAAADTAMYAAKQAGRNCCCVFAPAPAGQA